MGMVNRKDLMTRVAGQKAQFDDEFIARAQIKAGRNVIVEWDSIHDCYIHAVRGYDDNETYLESLIGLLKLERKPINAADLMFPSHGVYSVDGETVDIYNTAYGHNNPAITANMGYKYNEVYFADIWHNWNLTNPDDYLFEYQIKRTYQNGADIASYWANGEVLLHHYPIAPDAIRVYMQLPAQVHDHSRWKVSDNNITVPQFQGQSPLPMRIGTNYTDIYETPMTADVTDIQVMFKLSRMQWPVHANQV